MNKNILIICSFIFIAGINIFAQDKIIPVWEGCIPGEKRNNAYTEDTVYIDDHRPRIRHVTDPELQCFFPPAELNRMIAILIFPGGGYTRLAIDHEGIAMAKWLTTLGITSMIVKYRLPNDTIMTDKKFGPLMDAQQAIRVVRERAQELSIDPNKIGVIGFSAGGHLAASLCNHYSDTLYPAINFSSRPDFAALVYAVISFADSMTHSGSITNLLGINPDSKWVKYFSNELQVTSNTPPTFLVHAGDDKSVSVENSILYFEALQRAGVKSELHIYQTGGHGFGSGRGGTENGWRTAFENWINALYPNEKSKQK